MDLSVFFAGTAGSTPSARRGLPALLVRRGGEKLLFDCGEGTQRQLLRSIGLLDLDAVFITHFHADHWLGLPGMLKSLALRERTQPLTVYGPPGLGELMGSMRAAFGRLPYKLTIAELRPAEAVRGDGYVIAAIPVLHKGVSSYGYALVEDSRPGHLDPEVARQLGVAPGPDFGRLQRGEAVGGVTPEQVLGPEREGRKLVISGDTAPCEALAIAAHEADLLVHEATFLDAEAERARETNHSTARQAAELARRRRGAAARAHAPLQPLRRRRDPRRGARDLREHGRAARLRHDRDPVPRARTGDAAALGRPPGPRGPGRTATRAEESGPEQGKAAAPSPVAPPATDKRKPRQSPPPDTLPAIL